MTASPVGLPLRLTLDLVGDGLHRVLATLHRRAAHVEAMQYVASDDGTATLELTLRLDEQRLSHLREALERIVDVVGMTLTPEPHRLPVRATRYVPWLQPLSRQPTHST